MSAAGSSDVAVMPSARRASALSEIDFSVRARFRRLWTRLFGRNRPNSSAAAQTCALRSAALRGSGSGSMKIVAMVERGQSAGRLRQQHAVCRDVARHVAAARGRTGSD